MNPRQAGQEAFFFGELMQLRLQLGLSKAALAEILDVSIPTLYRWESYAMLSRLNDKNAERVAQFCTDARSVLKEFPNFATDYMSLARVAQRLGVPYEYLFHKYRHGLVPADDFGTLGIFLPVKALPLMKELTRG